MRVLVACEFSGVVRRAFSKRGHLAASCDLRPSEDGSIFHLQGDVRELLGQNWDLLIAHPPCTDIAVSGASSFKSKGYLRQKEAIDLFMCMVLCEIPKIAIENPVGIMSTVYRKPDQIIHPWMFGESFQKKTCLWLEGLLPLVPTKIVEHGEMVEFESGRKMPKWYADAWGMRKEERERYRSRTFQGIAEAMAEQWG